MVRQMITSPLFTNRAGLYPLLMGQLLVRGGGIQVDDALKRHGWDGKTAVAITIVTLETGA